MSEQELRDRLRAEVEGVVLPPGLADAVERGARRRRTGRLAAAGAAVAVAGVVGAAVTLVPDRAPVAAADPDDGCADLPAPAAVAPAPAGTDMSGWRWRGDPAVKGPVTELAELWTRLTEGGEAVTAARPVAGAATGTVGTGGLRHFAFAVAIEQASGWRLVVGEGITSPAEGVGPTAQTVLPLPAPTPGTVVSAYATLTPAIGGPDQAAPRSNVLVVLGAPGTGRIDYLGCRGGRTVRAGAAGDTLIEEVGAVEAAGRVVVTAGGRVVSSGRPQDVTKLTLGAAAPVTPPK